MSIGFVMLGRNGRNCSPGFNHSEWVCFVWENAVGLP